MGLTHAGSSSRAVGTPARLSFEGVFLPPAVAVRNGASDWLFEGVILDGRARLLGELPRSRPLCFEMGVALPGVDDAARILSRWL